MPPYAPCICDKMEKHIAVGITVTWCSVKQLWCYIGIADELLRLDLYVAMQNISFDIFPTRNVIQPN